MNPTDTPAYLSRQTSIGDIVNDKTNFLAKLYEEQIKQKEEREAAHKVDKEAERFTLRLDHDKFEKEQQEAQAAQNLKNRQQYEEFVKLSRQFQPDQLDSEKFHLQQQMALGFKPIDPSGNSKVQQKMGQARGSGSQAEHNKRVEPSPCGTPTN